MRRLLILFAMVFLVLMAIPNVVLAATDPWYDVRDYASFSAAVSAIGSTRASLRIPNAQSVTSSMTVPSNIQLFFIQGGQLNISNGVNVAINGPVEAPISQIFSCNGTGTVDFGSNSSIREVYPQWFGAIANDANDDQPYIQKAINSLPYGGMVFLPAGTYVVNDSISIASYTHLRGAGQGATCIDNHVTGASPGGSAIKFVGVVCASVSDLSVDLSLSGGQIGILLYGRSVAWCMNNYISNITVKSTGIISGQIGILEDGDTPNSSATVNNRIFNIYMQSLECPIVLTNQGENNILSNMHINGFGPPNGVGVAITLNSNANQISDFWVGSFDSQSTTRYAVAGNGSYNVIRGFCDIGYYDGHTGALVNLTGADNEVFGKAFWPAMSGSMGTAEYHQSLGRNRDCSYELNNATYPGADRDMFLAGVTGVTNGFTINYRNSTNAMQYTFLNGPIGIGMTPANSNILPGLQLAGGISQTSTQAANLRGSITISGTNSSVALSLPHSEIDANYFVTATATNSTGTPATGSKRVSIRDKSTSGFTVYLEAAPGAGNSVTVDWMLLR